MNTNVTLPKGFTQVCVWPGTTLGEGSPADFEKWIAEEFNGTRVHYLEIIHLCQFGKDTVKQSWILLPRRRMATLWTN